MFKRLCLSTSLLSLFCGIEGLAVSADWSRFRGPNGSGVADQLNIPDQFSIAENVLWKVEVGPGNSSPIAWNDRLFLTSFDDEDRTIACLDKAAGTVNWSATVPKLRDETATRPNNPATCTPVCDGTHVAVLFPDAGLFVYSLDGNLLWKKDIGPFYSMHGISASPIIDEGKLIVVVDQLQDSYVIAWDIQSGDELWKTERLIGVTGGYSTPAIATLGGQHVLISAAPGELVVYNTTTGEKLFSHVGMTNAPVGAPVIVDNRIYYSEPPGEPIPMQALGPADKNSDGVIELEEVKDSIGAYRLIERLDKGFGNSDGKVDQVEWDKGFGTFLNRGGLSCLELTSEQNTIQAKLLWQFNKTSPYIPSTLVLDGVVYIVNDGGILMSFQADTGELLKRERIGSATGQYYASPIAAGGRIVLANRDGKLSLVKSGTPWEWISTVDLGEPIISTPTISNGNLFVRTESSLYCFSNTPSGT